MSNALKEREELFKKQREKRGWDDSDTWSLDVAFSKLILPRLIRFKEIRVGHPCNMTDEKWEEIIDKMIFSHEFLAGEKSYDCYDKKIWKKVQTGLNLFAKYYCHLWW